MSTTHEQTGASGACPVCLFACLFINLEVATNVHPIHFLPCAATFVLVFEHEGLKIHASSPLSAFGTVHACLDTVASTPPADQSQACTDRARNHFFFQVSSGLVPEPGTVALRLIKTSRRLASSVPSMKASHCHYTDSK